MTRSISVENQGLVPICQAKPVLSRELATLLSSVPGYHKVAALRTAGDYRSHGH